ncbi:transposase family protein [Nonomuraea angiospora]|uniref:transposase family protein n=1 Tax=Nonomuraea angiospora TaxID=46172 RepID=UPI00341F007E
MPSSPIDVLARRLEHVTVADPLTDLLHLPALAEVLDAVPDPRSRRGRRYRLGPLLALSLLAVLGGATSLVKITRFIAGYDPDLRARAGLLGTPRLAASTLGRLLAHLDGDAFDTATCGYLASLAAGVPLATTSPPSHRAELTGLAVDGKTLRGSRTPDSTTAHLLSATRHDTQHTHARQIVTAGGHYLFIVKANQPTLLNRLKTLPWRNAILNDRTDESGHGRREIRRMKICTVRPSLPFPQTAQAIQVKRRRTGKTSIRPWVTLPTVFQDGSGTATHVPLWDRKVAAGTGSILKRDNALTVRCDSKKFGPGAPLPNTPPEKVVNYKGACIFPKAARVYTMSMSHVRMGEVAKHVNTAFTTPDLTIPTRTNPSKVFPGNWNAQPGSPQRVRLERLYKGAKAPDGRTWYSKNVAEKDRVCEDDFPNAAAQGKECDEFPFAVTYEGAGKGDGNYSILALDSSHNSSKGWHRAVFFARYRVGGGNPFWVSVQP